MNKVLKMEKMDVIPMPGSNDIYFSILKTSIGLL